MPRLSELLSTEEQAFVASLAVRRKYRDREIIHERGDAEDQVGIVVSGTLKMFNPRSDGTEIFSGLIHMGQSYGDAGLLHGGSRIHRAVAVGQTVIDHISRENFEKMLEHGPIVRALYMISSFRLATTLGLLDDIRTLSPDLRLARLLARMQRAVGGERRVNYLQEELAGMLGVSTVTLAKSLRRLTDEGLIQPGYRHIKLCDADHLAEWIDKQDTE